ncbi:hypothetical protein FQA47_004092 [Oryzias melastigma]|uniref:Uncharacterized protein n=1 Tax=Oryzias melastigma TaxID=30732 RepID=A0A834CCI9_ORYME|nr:hypothetical protein FQA47_004092 [Oryzias melastigma]
MSRSSSAASRPAAKPQQLLCTHIYNYAAVHSTTRAEFKNDKTGTPPAPGMTGTPERGSGGGIFRSSNRSRQEEAESQNPNPAHTAPTTLNGRWAFP